MEEKVGVFVCLFPADIRGPHMGRCTEEADITQESTICPENIGHADNFGVSNHIHSYGTFASKHPASGSVGQRKEGSLYASGRPDASRMNVNSQEWNTQDRQKPLGAKVARAMERRGKGRMDARFDP